MSVLATRNGYGKTRDSFLATRNGTEMKIKVLFATHNGHCKTRNLLLATRNGVEKKIKVFFATHYGHLAHITVMSQQEMPVVKQEMDTAKHEIHF